MKQFDHILNWRLLFGSHKFPGPDGGTCINEAAVVAAGFEYREIQSADDCPPCFSRVIAGYAIRLNDAMPDDLRQEMLMPFVTRLAGTADKNNVELRRATYLAVQTVKRILPISLRLVGLNDQAEKCEQAETAKAAIYAAAAANAANAANAAADAAVADAAAKAVYAAVAAAADAANAANAAAAAKAVDAAAKAAAKAAKAVYAGVADAAAAADAANAANAAAAAKAVYAGVAAAKKEIFSIAIEILDGAISLGKQADPIDAALVCSRLEQAKQLVAI